MTGRVEGRAPARDGATTGRRRSAPLRLPGPLWLREIAVALAFYYAYDLVRGLISGGAARAERDGRDVLHWEQVLHLDPEHAVNNALQHLTWLAVPACYFYATLHFVVTPAVLVWVYRRHGDRYRDLRTVLAVLTGSALIGFWLFPTAPPRLLPDAGFLDTLALFHSWGWWGAGASVPTAAAGLANEYAAMPSLHVAWALWSGAAVVLLARRRWVRLLGAAYPVLTAFVVMATANHFMLDVVAGALLWLVSYLAVERVARRLRLRAARR